MSSENDHICYAISPHACAAVLKPLLAKKRRRAALQADTLPKSVVERGCKKKTADDARGDLF